MECGVADPLLPLAIYYKLFYVFYFKYLYDESIGQLTLFRDSREFVQPGNPRRYTVVATAEVCTLS